MALTYFGEGDVYGEILEALNTTFALVFTLEAGLKLTALGGQYFFEKWNCFDLRCARRTHIGRKRKHRQMPTRIHRQTSCCTKRHFCGVFFCGILKWVLCVCLAVHASARAF